MESLDLAEATAWKGEAYGREPANRNKQQWALSDYFCTNIPSFFWFYGFHLIPHTTLQIPCNILRKLRQLSKVTIQEVYAWLGVILPTISILHQPLQTVIPAFIWESPTLLAHHVL